MKAKTKAREPLKSKLNNFFISLQSFGVFYLHISVFLSFKAIKAKKATLVAENTKLHSKLFLFS